MPRSRSVCALLATVALGALPGSALAQSAGDDQYTDPFGDESATPAAKATPAPAAAPSQSSGSAPSATPAPSARTSGADPDGSSAGTKATAAAPSAKDQLPRTGKDAGRLAVAGLGLVAAGAGLRLRLRDGAERA